MFQVLRSWYRSLLSDPNSATFFIIIAVLFTVIYFYSGIFMPILVALGVSYILEAPINFLERKKILRRTISTYIIILLFFVFLGLFCVYVGPSIVSQGSDLINRIPSIISQTSDYIKAKIEEYPHIFEHIDIDAISAHITNSITSFSTEFIKSNLLGYLMNVTSFVMYLILIPLLAFFMLKDKHVLIAGVKGFFPPNLELASDMWKKMNTQLMNYVSGKFIHIIVISVLNFIIFYCFGLNYAILLGLLVGLSVLIPVVGAGIVTVPVALVAFTQFGADSTLWTLLGVYAAGLALDANLITPMLFSEKMKLHPFVILASVLVFGSMWGFWGVFFAIPLATFFKTIYLNWPRGKYVDSDVSCETGNFQDNAGGRSAAQTARDDLEEVVETLSSARKKLGAVLNELDCIEADVCSVSKEEAQEKADEVKN
jgi:putative permease